MVSCCDLDCLTKGENQCHLTTVANEVDNVESTKPTQSEVSVDEPSSTGYRYAELDTTTYNDCYGVPNTATVLHAISLTFAADPTKKPIRLTGRNTGLWRIETNNIHLYEQTKILTYRDQNIGTISIKCEEKKVNSEGRIITMTKREKRELLITL